MKATGHDFYNQAYANKRAVEVALDALRKIRLGHPCDVPELIAYYAVEEIEELIGPPTRRDLHHASDTITKG